MLGEMKPGQLEEWRAYADVEPFDEERADIRAGSIVQEIRNHHRPKGQRFAKLDDCIVRFVPRKSEPAGTGPMAAVDKVTMSSFNELAEAARAMRARRQRAEKVSQSPKKRTPMRPQPPAPRARAGK